VSTSGERLDILDGLRGLAISLVVWYHAWLVSGATVAYVNFIAEAGFLGVDLFFFISGFCLFYPYARAVLEGRPLPTTRRFFLRRAAKIVPSYLLALIVFAAVYRDRFASAPDAAIQIASHLTPFFTFNTATFGGISGPLWTIGIETQFYLLFPLICVPFRKWPALTYVGLAAISEGYRWGLGALGLDSSFSYFNQLPAYFDIFAAGMLAAYGLVALRKRPALPNQLLLAGVSAVLLGCALAGLAYIAWINRTAGIDACYAWVNAHRIVVGPLCIAIAISTAYASGPWRRLLGAKPLVFLSVISYNLYLWNLEIAVWCKNAGLPSAVAFSLAVVASLAIATAITYVLERPILEATEPKRIPGLAARPAAQPLPVRQRS
jgi:peptidoglycan/LPS O-acetylase OafA/YrhL